METPALAVLAHAEDRRVFRKKLYHILRQILRHGQRSLPKGKEWHCQSKSGSVFLVVQQIGGDGPPVCHNSVIVRKTRCPWLCQVDCNTCNLWKLACVVIAG